MSIIKTSNFLSPRLALSRNTSLAPPNLLASGIMEKKDKIDKPQNSQAKGYTEKITALKFILFVIYVVSFLLVINLHVNFPQKFKINTAIYQFFLNQIEDFDTYPEITDDKMRFYDISSATNITSWIKQNVINGLYSNINGGLITNSNKENKIMYPPITPLRIVQKRAKIKHKPFNENFPMPWDLNAQSGNTTTYGSTSQNITYSSQDNGFNITIPVSLLILDDAEQSFDNVANNGYFDFQTRDVTVDFTVFDTRLGLATYFQAYFQFSPSGRISKQNHEIVSFPVRFYTDTKGRATIFFQILFVALFFYYAYNEVNNVKNHISSMFYERLKADQGHGAVQKIQLEASKCKDRAKLTIKGIANHLLDPWHFFNTLIIVCSGAIIITWLIIVSKNRLYKLLQAYESSTENLDIIYNSNDEMQILKKQTIRVLQFAAINILIMMIKFVQYLSFLSMRMKVLSQIIGEITARLTYFFIVLGVILVSFTYMIYNFFGDSIEEFKNPFSIFRYLITGLNFDYSQIDNMLKSDQNATIIFHILFILIVIFILSNLFSVYVIRGVDEYMKKRRIAKKANQDIKKNPFNFRPHPVWRFKNFLNQKLPLFCYSIFSKEKVVQAQHKIDRENKNLEKQLKNHRHLNFDASVDNSDESITKFDPLFNNEASILKHKQSQKVKTVRIVWSVVAVWVSFVFFQIIATNHHKITEGSNIKSTLKFMFEQTNIKQQRADGQVGNFSSDISISNLRNPHDILNWITSLFVNYASENTYTLADKGEYSGYYVQDTNFLISNQYRLSIRKRSIEQVEPDVYNGYSNYVFSDIFKADAKNPSGESTAQVQGSNSSTLYNYTESSGYHNAGGYVLTSTIAEFSDLFTKIRSDRFINSTINSIVIDFPLFNINTEDVIYAALIFELQEGFNIKTTMTIDYIGLAFYDTAGGVFIAILEVLTILWFVLFSRTLYHRLKISNEHYDFWYATHIFHLPQIVKDQREKKNPELLRKFTYVVGFSNFLNILILVCYFVSMILWVRNLAGVSIINKNMNKFHNSDPEADNDQLLSSITTLVPWFDASKFLESLVLFLTTIKLLYYYSNFSPFQFLTLTIRKSLEWISFMFIILIIYVIGFGLFMQMIKGNQAETYSQFFQLLVEQMQAVNMMIKGEKQFISENYGTFITLIFYFPWVMFVTYIIAGMFNGIVYNSYRAAVKHQQEMELYKTNLSIRDFFTITMERLKRKKSQNIQQKTAHFEINDQLRNKFNSQQVFNDFDKAINLAYDIRDPKTWAANCTNIIKSENEHRKNMKTTSKEILKASVVDFDQEKHTHKKIMNDKEKLSHFELRLQYWNYFKSGNDMLLQHMHSLNQGINLLEEKVNDPEVRLAQRSADNKINKYILELEAKVSQNLGDIQNMKRTLDQYQYQS